MSFYQSTSVNCSLNMLNWVINQWPYPPTPTTFHMLTHPLTKPMTFVHWIIYPPYTMYTDHRPTGCNSSSVLHVLQRVGVLQLPSGDYCVKNEGSIGWVSWEFLISIINHWSDYIYQFIFMPLHAIGMAGGIYRLSILPSFCHSVILVWTISLWYCL